MAFGLFFKVIMATLNEITLKVNRRLIDTTAATTAESTILVNRALRMIQELRNFKIMEEQVEYTTVQAQQLLNALPSDFKSSRGAPWIHEWDGGTTLIEWGPSIEEMAKLFPLDDVTVTGQGKPVYVLWNNNQIEVYPYPDDKSNFAGGGDWRVVVPYWKFIPDLVNPSDTNWFTSNAEWFLVFQAVAESFYINWDEERARMWEERAAIEFKKAKKFDKNAVMTRQSDTLTPRYAVRGSFRGGR